MEIYISFNLFKTCLCSNFSFIRVMVWQEIWEFLWKLLNKSNFFLGILTKNYHLNTITGEIGVPSGTGLARQKLSVVGRVRLIGDGANSLFKAEHSPHQERSVQLSETDDDDDIARFYSRDEHKTSHHVILCSMNTHDTYIFSHCIGTFSNSDFFWDQ